jgi:hypothetical protein
MRKFSIAGGGSLVHGNQRSRSCTRKISLEESIKIALEHNLDVQIERLNPEISATI